MDEGFAFKLGTGLSLLSGLFFYFAKKEYNQADAIKNAPEIKVSDLQKIIATNNKLFAKISGYVTTKQPIKLENGEEVVIHQQLILGRSVNLRWPSNSLYPVHRTENRADWGLASSPSQTNDDLRITYLAQPELDTVSEREEPVGASFISAAFSLLGIRYPTSYVHQVNVLRPHVKLFAVGEVTASSAGREAILTPSGAGPFLVTRLSEHEVVQQYEGRARTWQQYSSGSALAALSLLLYSLYKSK